MQHAGPEQPAPCRRSRRAGLGRIEAVLLFVLLGGGWLCLASGVYPLKHAHSRSNRTKCSGNLRQLALAALQYADDKRFFPHVGPIAQLDGGTDSNATTKVVRTLVWYGYHDNPEGFVCPASYDMFLPIIDQDVKGNMRRWFWAGEVLDGATEPPLVDRRRDPILDATDELSYGWTRRGMNSNARSTGLLAGDRAQADPQVREGVEAADVGKYGNHDTGSNVAYVDGTVSFVTGGPDGPERLAATADATRDGFLAIRPPTRLAPVMDRMGVRDSAWFPCAVVFGPPGVLLLLLVVRVGRSASAPEPPLKVVLSQRGAVTPVRPSRVATLGPEERATLGLGKPPTPGGPVVLQHQQRCPLCHDAVGVEDPLSRCLDCRAVFHAECVAPGAACPTLGCGARS